MIRLKCPLKDEQADALTELVDDPLAAGQLKEIRTGYDTILLRATRGIWQVEKSPDGLIARSVSQDDSRDERKLKLIAARALAAEGQISQAHSQIEALRLVAPDDPEIAAALAGIYFSEGRWADARDAYKEAFAKAPRFSTQQAITEIDQEHGDRVLLNVSNESSNTGLSQTIIHVEGDRQAADGWQASVHEDTAFVRATGIPQLSGAVTNVSSWVERDDIGVRREFRDGSALGAILYTGRDLSPGGGLDWSSYFANGVTSLHGEYNRPNWDFIQGALGGATRDQVSVSRTQQLYGFFGSEAKAQVGVERYRMGGATDAQSVSANGEFRVPLPNIATTNLAAVYQFNGEYFFRVRSIVGAAGQPFQPLPAGNYAVNVFSVEWSGKVFMPYEQSALLWSVTPGYSVDPFGRNGLALNASLKYVAGPSEARIYMERGVAAKWGNETATTVGAAIKWVFN